MSDLDLFVPRRKPGVTKRNDRVASQIREIFSMAIAKADFPPARCHRTREILDMPEHITITYVDVSSDLRQAKIYVSILDENKKEQMLQFLEAQTYFFKNIIATKMNMKFIPDILFKIDNSLEYSQRIDSILKQI